MRVNKSELAQILGVSLPTISAYIARYGEAFPVLERGGRGRDYWFDHEEVQAFLDSVRTKEEAENAERQAAIQQFALPLGHNGGPKLTEEAPMRPAELLTLMKVRRMQREEAYACGRLVKAAEVAAHLEDLIGRWGRELHATLRQFGARKGIDASLMAELKAELLDAQKRLVAYGKTLDEVSAKTRSSKSHKLALETDATGLDLD